MTHPRRLLAASVVLVLLAAAGCGKDPTSNNIPTGISVQSGDHQAGAVGNALPTTVVFKVVNADGGVPGISVSVAVPPGQGGSGSPRNGKTGAGGLFAVTWTLGGIVGAQTLTATASGGFSATATATASAGAASVVTAVSDVFQNVVVGHAVSLRPSVKVTDAFSNPLPGVAVTFEALTPGEVLTGTAQTTDANGLATLGSWTIGPDAVSYVVRGGIPSGAVAVFEARGIPATVTAVAGDGQTANVGTIVPVLPAVKAARDDGSPLAGVAVTYVISNGGGRVDGGTVVTGLDGTARPTRWVLGTTPGTNRLSAQSQGRDPVTFTATGVAATPASLVAASPTAQTGFFGNYTPSRPAVLVKDAQGNPVAGTPVSFAITQGDGSISGATQTTDFEGRATLASWRLGAAATQAVQTTSPFTPVTFTATPGAPPASTFKITVRYDLTCTGCLAPTVAQRAAFDAAVARWTQLLVRGGPPYLVFEDATPCAPSIIGETVDGVVIYAHLVPIDGVNGVLGQSGPCILRDDPGYLAAEGLMEFDTADLAVLEASGQLNQVILHEMGHVLGFGTIWDFDPFPGQKPANAFLVGFGGLDPFFNGDGARSAFFGSAAAGTTFTGNPVPVEAGGGAGTAYSHWRESRFGSELMTGFLNSGINPLSAITVDQFRDLGYVVNDALADSYTFQASLRSALETPLQLIEGKVPGDIIVINRQGHEARRIPRR
ncbi:MAG TPA: leishmanolysin-related zinc metalloendopeptidase [Gemmatimonadales bacterium]|jgi:hypothetical protein|nr:leishmanolysin-related zinc metalloendopeptidase [Gemmatimonadales bacterium]